MIEKLKIDIASLNEELISDKKNFNERINANPIGLVGYNKSMDMLLCLSDTPSDSAHNFYDIYSGLFEFAKNLKVEHPEYREDVFSKNLEEFCMEDATIRAYMIEHLHIPSQSNILAFARKVVDMYSVLEFLGFNEIIEKEQLLKKKREELSSLEGNANNIIQPVEDQLEKIGDITKGLINKGAKKLINIATIVKNKTDKK